MSPIKSKIQLCSVKFQVPTSVQKTMATVSTCVLPLHQAGHATVPMTLLQKMQPAAPVKSAHLIPDNVWTKPACQLRNSVMVMLTAPITRMKTVWILYFYHYSSLSAELKPGFSFKVLVLSRDREPKQLLLEVLKAHCLLIQYPQRRGKTPWKMAVRSGTWKLSSVTRIFAMGMESVLKPMGSEHVNV